MRRRAEAERDLFRARGTNFENPDTSQVSIGTVVTLRDMAGTEETYCILGAWDSAPELGIISYKAVIGQALLGKGVGESAELPTESGTRSVTIVRIEPFTKIGRSPRESSPAFRAGHRLNALPREICLQPGARKRFWNSPPLTLHFHVRYPDYSRHRPPNH